MYLPRGLISQLYLDLVQTHHPLAAPILILVALEPDALCACRILTSLLKRDYVAHKIQPISGYRHLRRVGMELIQPMRLAAGGGGGLVACIGVGGSIDLQKMLGLEADEQNKEDFDGVNVWVFDAMRPWNLANVFGGHPAVYSDESSEAEATLRRNAGGVDRGEVKRSYKSTQTGGIIVFDDGDIEEDLAAEREAWFALEEIPAIDEHEREFGKLDFDDEHNGLQISSTTPKKRKSWSDRDEDSESEKENIRPRQRRRSNLSPAIPSSPVDQSWRSAAQPSERQATDIHSTPPSNQQASSFTMNLPNQMQTSQSLRRRLLRLRRRHRAVLKEYHTLGTSYSAPISALMYSLASELGCEDNDILWLAIVGISSAELYGRTVTGFSLSNSDEPRVANCWGSARESHIRQLLQDEVQRLNPPEVTEEGREVNYGHATDVIPTHARSPTDTSIRLSPEPRFLLVRHWSLYDSMLHSPYLSAKLHIWSDAGRRRLHKLLAKMGMSLTECKQSYTHMDMNLKKILRERLLQFAPHYGLDGLVPPSSIDPSNREGWGFVRSWGWKACLSATDVAVVIGAILEIGFHARPPSIAASSGTSAAQLQSSGFLLSNTCNASSTSTHDKFYAAYDALLSPSTLMAAIPSAQSLHRAILRTGTTLLQKRQIRHVRAFRMAIIKEGPDVVMFTNPGALTKLALWVGEAVREIEKDSGKAANGADSTPLVLACIDEERGVYIVVGLGGAGETINIDKGQSKGKRSQTKEEQKKQREEELRQRNTDRQERQKRLGHSNDESGEDYEEDETEEEDSTHSEDEDVGRVNDGDEASKQIQKRSVRRNRFGNAFQEVIEETNAQLQLDSFDHCVVEVQKEDLSCFLESLSMKAVVT